MTIQTEIQSLAPSALVELFVLDASALAPGEILYFHAGTNALQQPVVWQGQTYQPLPIEAEGFDIQTKGALPRPKLRVANVNGMFSAEVARLDDLVSAKVIRKRTFARYLDAVNFPGGVNPDADPNQHFPDDLWFIDRKMTENRHVIEWELASAFDLEGVKLPYRQILQNSCPWKYRGAECGYTGAPFDKNDQPCAPADDFCAKRLSSCKARFDTLGTTVYTVLGTPVVITPPLPFGGFPGATRLE